MGKEEILKNLIKHKKRIEEDFDVNEIGIFGSYVRGEQKAKSDLDVLVEFNATPSFFKFIKLEDYLSGILGAKVDLVRKKAIRPELKEIILKETIYP